jgi:hypothetical protein
MDLGGQGYTPFERELLFYVLDAATRDADILREQIALSRAVRREFTGHGSFTEIEVSRAAPSAIGAAEQCFVGIWRPGFEAPAGCIIFVDAEGYVDLLEVYAHAPDTWSDDPAVWKIVAGDPLGNPRNPFDRPPNDL